MIQPSSTLLNATVERLARDGVPLAVQVTDAVHLWPLRPITDTREYVHARRAFMNLTDGRIVFHDPVSPQ